MKDQLKRVASRWLPDRRVVIGVSVGLAMGVAGVAGAASSDGGFLGGTSLGGSLESIGNGWDALAQAGGNISEYFTDQQAPIEQQIKNDSQAACASMQESLKTSQDSKVALSLNAFNPHQFFDQSRSCMAKFQKLVDLSKFLNFPDNPWDALSEAAISYAKQYAEGKLCEAVNDLSGRVADQINPVISSINSEIKPVADVWGDPYTFSSNSSSSTFGGVSGDSIRLSTGGGVKCYNDAGAVVSCGSGGVVNDDVVVIPDITNGGGGSNCNSSALQSTIARESELSAQIASKLGTLEANKLTIQSHEAKIAELDRVYSFCRNYGGISSKPSGSTSSYDSTPYFLCDMKYIPEKTSATNAINSLSAANQTLEQELSALRSELSSVTLTKNTLIAQCTSTTGSTQTSTSGSGSTSTTQNYTPQTYRSKTVKSEEGGDSAISTLLDRIMKW
jgi:hypothetical protein